MLLFAFRIHVPLHVSDVIVLRDIAILLHIRTLVLGHSSDKIIDDFIRNEGVAEVKLCNIWLSSVSIA